MLVVFPERVHVHHPRHLLYVPSRWLRLPCSHDEHHDVTRTNDDDDDDDDINPRRVPVREHYLHI